MDYDLSPSLITTGLNTKFVGRNIICLPVTTSTMDDAKEQARKHAPEGTAVFAEEQTLGRGRLKRSWVTPPGSCIATTIVLYPDAKTLPYLIMVASLAVAEAIEKTTGLKAQIKWPNDVLLNGKKVCGILIENGFRGSNVAYAVIGIGINVNIRITEIPEIAAVATSLHDATGNDVPRLAVLQNLYRSVEALYLEAKQDHAVFEKWRDRLITLGKRVRATSSGSVQEGVAESVNPDGSLMLRKPDGSLVRIIAEDVTLRE